MSYTRFGPFTDGSSPGISAEFLNPVEDQLVAMNSAATDADISAASGIFAATGLNITPTAVVINGGTSGTATLYQDCTGTIKRVLVVENNFRTAGAAQTIAIPVPFTAKFWVRTGFIDRVQFLSSGTAQSVNVMTAFGASGSAIGSTAGATTVFGFAIGECLHPCDAISWPASGAAANNGMILLEGI